MVAKTFVSKKAPVEPEWHKKLRPIAVLAGKSGTLRGSPEAVAFANMCRHLKASGVLVAWELEMGMSATTVSWAKWVARDPQWSGRV